MAQDATGLNSTELKGHHQLFIPDRMNDSAEGWGHELAGSQDGEKSRVTGAEVSEGPGGRQIQFDEIRLFSLYVSRITQRLNKGMLFTGVSFKKETKSTDCF